MLVNLSFGFECKKIGRVRINYFFKFLTFDDSTNQQYPFKVNLYYKIFVQRLGRTNKKLFFHSNSIEELLTLFRKNVFNVGA